MKVKKIAFIFVFLTLFCPSLLQGQKQDSLQLKQIANKIFFAELGISSLPFLLASSQTSYSDHIVRSIRMDNVPKFHYSYDDYLQYAPLGIQFSMAMMGVSGRSKGRIELLVADALAGAFTLAFTSIGKYSIRRERPDYSSKNSYPSGHTATAFMSATLLNLEYGERFPWLSVLGYTLATATGYSRVLNNRHWMSDVWAGAGIGVVSAYLAYWLRDLFFKRDVKDYFSFPDWDNFPKFQLNYKFFNGNLLFLKNPQICNSLRSEVAFSYKFYERRDLFYLLSLVGGSFLLKDVDRNSIPNWYIGPQISLYHPIQSRLAIGGEFSLNFFLGNRTYTFYEIGARGIFDYFISNRNSIRFYMGFTNGFKLNNLEYRFKNNLKESLFLLFESGFSLNFLF